VGGNIGKISKKPLKTFNFSMTVVNSSCTQTSLNVLAVLCDDFIL